MSEREPALLGDEPRGERDDEDSREGRAEAEPQADAEPEPEPDAEAEPDAEPEPEPEPKPEPAPRPAARSRAEAKRFHAAGFWIRFLASLLDLAVIVPVALLLSWLIGKIAGYGMPPNIGLDYLLDLLLGSDPSMVTVAVMLTITAGLYALVFQIIAAQTLGMRVCRLRIIDVYGDPPSMGRAAIRTLGYLANMLTLGLGFIWIGFDSEKRGLHDWIASTYVVKA